MDMRTKRIQEMVQELVEQDIVIKGILNMRSELSDMAKEEGIYDEVIELLYDDLESHHYF